MGNRGFFSFSKGDLLPPLVLINEIRTGGGTNTITFADIPTGFRILKIWGFMRDDYGGANGDSVYMYFNEDTTAAHYRSENIIAYTNTLTRSSTATAFIANTSDAASAATYYGALMVDIPYYKENYNAKVATVVSGFKVDSSSQYVRQYLTTLTWNTVSPIYQIDFTMGNGNYVAGTKIAMYGIP
jgi:hypothetical protein